MTSNGVVIFVFGKLSCLIDSDKLPALESDFFFFLFFPFVHLKLIATNASNNLSNLIKTPLVNSKKDIEKKTKKKKKKMTQAFGSWFFISLINQCNSIESN